MVHETPLEGGNASDSVMKVGGTVHKASTGHSSGVQNYMRALRQRGVDVPKPLGFDELGRSVTEYVPGHLAIDAEPLTPEQLHDVGEMVRCIHDASRGLDASELGLASALIPTPDPDLVCHGDLTPWNLVLGERSVFIDWDGAAASTRLWDLSYSVQAFTLNDPDARPLHSAANLRAFIQGYGAVPSLRSALLETLPRRAQAMHDHLEKAHQEGQEPWASMFVNEHGTHWSQVARYVDKHAHVWRTALRAS